MNLKEVMQESIEHDCNRLNHYRRVKHDIKLTGRLVKKTSANRKYSQYYHKKPGEKLKYLNKSDWKVINALQRKRLAEQMIEILTNNIRAKELFCEMYREDDAVKVMQSLPRSYRPDDIRMNEELSAKHPFPQSENPFNREYLNKKTSFGLYVRSKSELQIAELLYSLGIEFYYEKGLTLEWYDEEGYQVKTYYPDFTIVLANGEEIYWEHKGMISRNDYTERDIQKEIAYNLNGIYQSHNYVVTADGPNGEMDMEGVKLLVQGWIIPIMAV